MKYVKRVIFLFVVLCFSSSVFAQFPSRPKLVVGIVVDQMRWDYLYRYYDRYSSGGFKRLLNEGFSCENTFINYLPSFTAVGHSAIYTGSVPAIHGITGNEWMDQQTGRKWYCTEDTMEKTVGSATSAGNMSPRNLLVSTVTDELKLATNFKSRVVGVSLKDRASILPAGHTADGAFWLDDSSSNFITSTYYMKQLPDWVRAFNNKKEPEKLMKGKWIPLYPLNSYTESSVDAVEWEGRFKNEKTSAFPHNLESIYRSDPLNLRYTPFGNTLTFDFAKAAIEGYRLGQSITTDFLTINCASTDYVGHMYGPNSIEVEDTYLRLDRELAIFFKFLDEKIGRGKYLLFLTADHGAAHSVGFMQAHDLPSGFLPAGKIMGQLDSLLQKDFGVAKLIRSELNYHVNFDEKKIETKGLDYDSIKKVTVNFLKQQPGVQFVVDIEKIGITPIPQPIKTMIINGYNKKRTGPVIIIPEPGWFEGFEKGTTHGGWNDYDTHIPLLFMGWHIKHGASEKRYHITDIAPTIAGLLHIQMPNGCIGKGIKTLVNQ